MAGSDWADVPAPLAENIFRRVGDRSPEEAPHPGAGTAAARLVCRRWSALSTAGIRKLRPKRFFPGLATWPSLTALDLGGCNSTDNIIRRLRHFGRLTDLDLGSSEVTLSGLVYLRPLTALRTLCLCDTDIGERELEEVARHRSLTSLNIHSCELLTDDALQRLRPLTALTALFLDTSFAVTDAGVAVVQWMPHLRELDMNCTGGVTDVGVLTIATLTNLTALGLRETKEMTPAGLRALWKLTALTSLDLFGCGCRDLRPPPLQLRPITDDHLVWLSTCLQRLEVLDLRGIGSVKMDADGHWDHTADLDEPTTITAAGVARLRGGLPGCEIAF